MKISEAIKEIIKLKGLTIFNDYKRFKGFLADFSTGTHKKELDVFKNAVDENMLKMCIDDSLEEYRKILKLQIQLENKGLTQDWINFIIESFALPLGWNYTPKPTNQQTQQVQKQNISSSQNEWTCSCGCVNNGNFCSNCGMAKPTPKVSNDWTCVCGAVNNGNFCSNCGKQKGQQQVQMQKTSTQQKPSIQQQQQAKQQITKQTQTQQKQQAQQSVQKLGNPFKNAKIGDYVKFGSYPQTSNCQNQPIEWQVLSKENNKMLVISKYGLDARRFNSSSNNWENSEIRKWLNGDFYNKAFSEDDKKFINFSNLSDVGTGDNVFLLSKEEAKKYFANDTARQCKATDYAVKNGALVANNGYSVWWIRSLRPHSIHYVYFFDVGGELSSYYSVYIRYVVARPALWINL